MSEGLPPLPAPEQLQQAAEALRARAKALAALSRAVAGGAPLDIAAAQARVAQAPLPEDPEPAVAGWVAAELESRRRRLAVELRACCDAHGIPARVLERAPLRLRLAPFSLEVDVEADRAVLGFGRAPLRRCRAEAEAIVQAHQELLARLSTHGLEREHRALREAWRVAGGSPAQPWVPLLRVWSAHSWLAQPERFHRDPGPGTFVEQPRAAFLFALHRLRSAGALEQEGWRLGLGTAAGNSMRDRAAVFWVEDAEGHGQWHHTLRFTRDA